MNTYAKEAVGTNYVLQSMRTARDRTWEVIHEVAARIEPGMLESEATAHCKTVLNDFGIDRIWHPVLVRFGPNTVKTFKERSDGDPRLDENDIFFLDLGVVWEGHEGDAGATFVVGHDDTMKECAAAAKSVFDEVEGQWRTAKMGGRELYDFAATCASKLGWTLNLDIKGHRVSDFPHAIYRAGDLGDYEDHPNPGLWILEVQIAHPSLPYGAFYEDLLV